MKTETFSFHGNTIEVTAANPEMVANETMQFYFERIHNDGYAPLDCIVEGMERSYRNDFDETVNIRIIRYN